MSVRRSKRRPLRLKTADGTVRRRLPRVRRRKAASNVPRINPGQFLIDSLDKRWRTFGKRVRKGLPRRGRRSMDEAVHDLRTASRRLLSVLQAVERLGARKSVRRLARRVDRVLARLGRLRDLTVQREMLSRLTAPSRRSVPGGFERAAARDFRRLARKARRRLRGEDLATLNDDKRRILRRLCRCGEDDSDTRGKVLDAARDAAASLRARRASVDPTRVGTLHEMRIALKSFRYLMEGLKPLAPGVSENALQTLQVLQTTMGDLHDLEVLSSALATCVKKGSSKRAAKLAPVLAELEAKHSKMLQSFLKSADPILEYWDEVLSAAPAASAHRPG